MKYLPILDRMLTAGHAQLLAGLDEDSVDTVERRSRERLAEMAPRTPSFKQAMNRKLFETVMPCAALYGALREVEGLDQDQAVELAAQVIEADNRTVVEGSAILSWFVSTLGRWRLPTWAMQHFMLGLREPHGWLAEPVESDAPIAFDTVRCAAHEFLEDEGMAELAPVLCAMDHVAVEYMPGLALHRTTTLAEGGVRCDFRYVRSSR